MQHCAVRIHAVTRQLGEGHPSQLSELGFPNAVVFKLDPGGQNGVGNRGNCSKQKEWTIAKAQGLVSLPYVLGLMPPPSYQGSWKSALLFMVATRLCKLHLSHSLQENHAFLFTLFGSQREPRKSQQVMNPLSSRGLAPPYSGMAKQEKKKTLYFLIEQMNICWTCSCWSIRIIKCFGRLNKPILHGLNQYFLKIEELFLAQKSCAVSFKRVFPTKRKMQKIIGSLQSPWGPALLSSVIGLISCTISGSCSSHTGGLVVYSNNIQQRVGETNKRGGLGAVRLQQLAIRKDLTCWS